MGTESPGGPPAGERLDVYGAIMAITADGADTDGEFAVVDMWAPPGFENGLHTHGPAEVFHVVEGEMLLDVEGERTRLTPGTTGHVGGGREHALRVVGETDLRAVTVFSPAGAEDFLRAVGEPAGPGATPAYREVTAADLEHLEAVGAEHGFDFLGPFPDGSRGGAADQAGDGATDT